MFERNLIYLILDILLIYTESNQSEFFEQIEKAVKYNHASSCRWLKR